MTADGDVDGTTLTPDDAFGVLGNETRMEILQTLAQADEPLRFSDLRERVGMRDSGQFNYHLDQLSAHFVEGTDDGYKLRGAGRRVVQAVLSGAVTEAPELDRKRIDRSCPYCSATPLEMSYREGQVGMYCPECDGTYGQTGDSAGTPLPAEQARIGYSYLPPAGVRGRTPEEVLEAAIIWTDTEAQALFQGVCPRCSASVRHSVDACQEHETTDGVCDHCNRRFAIQFQGHCTNCPYELGGPPMVTLLKNGDVQAFLIDHGINPVDEFAPEIMTTITVTEELVETDPFEARFTLTVGDDALTLTVNDDLAVVEVTERNPSETT